EGERELAVRAVAADRDLPARRVDRLVGGVGNVGEVVAHEKCVVGRDRVAEIFDRRLVVGRPIAHLDQRLLAGQRLQGGLAAQAGGKCRRQVELAGVRTRRACKTAKSRQRRTGARAFEQATSRDHRILPSMLLLWVPAGRPVWLQTGKPLADNVYNKRDAQLVGIGNYFPRRGAAAECPHPRARSVVSGTPLRRLRTVAASRHLARKRRSHPDVPLWETGRVCTLTEELANRREESCV